MKKDQPSSPAPANERSKGPIIRKGRTVNGDHFIAALGKRAAKGTAHLAEVKQAFEKHVPDKN
jgi:hypothetical protein